MRLLKTRGRVYRDRTTESPWRQIRRRTKSILNDPQIRQYQINNIHGWHIHGHNFTGVYYLDLPTDAPKTQIVNPFNQEQILIPEVGEGEILMIPSYVIHSGPKIKKNISKTVVSFNCIFHNK